MKILSAAFFLSVGLALGTAISTLMAAAAPNAGVHAQPAAAAQESTAAVTPAATEDRPAPQPSING